MLNDINGAWLEKGELKQQDVKTVFEAIFKKRAIRIYIALE